MKYYLFLLLIITSEFSAQEFKIGRLKYSGGGDWYNDPSGEINLLNYIKANTTINVNPQYNFVDISSDEIFNYSFLFLTGHGNVSFSDSEVLRLRKYLMNGGFLYIDDDYGIDNFIKREMKKVLPDNDFIELPFNYGLYSCFYKFNYGPPKIHEHDNKPPQGLGIILNNRLAIYYTYESNPGDGWTDKRVHNLSDELREEALKFGTNLVIWALIN